MNISNINGNKHVYGKCKAHVEDVLDKYYPKQRNIVYN